ncbi:MAG: hypothetical protein KY476_04965 [Planctomycetes bacterium]|nr:hypothetical protein [Planctomycetota bacterium]
MRRSTCILVPLLSAVLCGLPRAHAHDGHAPHADDEGERQTNRGGTGPHGGELSAAGEAVCEVVFQPKSVRVYVYDRSGRPLPAEDVRGSVTMIVTGNPREYRYDLYPESTDDAETNSLLLPVDLSRVPDEAMTASFSLHGLPAAGRRPVSFAQTFRLTRPAASAPVRAAASDAAAIAAQKICPVMGEPLGSMGRPWKTTVEGREVFVCCKGCLKSLDKAPAKYLAKLPDPPPVRADRDDAAAVARQKLCPVMDEPLGSMGTPWKVTVKGQDVFVCCKGCIAKVQRNPELYLSKTGRSEQTGRPAE